MPVRDPTRRASTGSHTAGNESGLHVFHRETGSVVDVVTEDVGAFIGWAALADRVWLVGAERAVRIDAKSLQITDATEQLGDDVPFALAGGRYWARTPLGGLASYARDRPIAACTPCQERSSPTPP